MKNGILDTKKRKLVEQIDLFCQPIKLNENQKLVYDYINESLSESGDYFLAVKSLVNLCYFPFRKEQGNEIVYAYQKLSKKEQQEILQLLVNQN
ncbi:hypothetical protein R6Z02_15670 [Carnobacterium maltaromaticum]|uniref:hypothetical protein n=1 Tax=Lactobacillales TaxID=186826 RepID=UPI000550C255|nr:hypothetical protein [Carnobacterium maltaromaticum]KRN68647.1 hypothetical protein IV70_GL000957 [Carnobacterium maltaromaticum DSM 20342]MDW5525191.1 hypothetical protein [Carnobacterium maltaromaticum]